MISDFKAALFDLDGVVLDTESQYSVFWGEMGRRYHPEVPDFAELIKGQTLTQIFDRWFSGEREHLREPITDELNAFEQQMSYTYINGVREYLESLKAAGISTAIVTSSNKPKMQKVMEAHPEFSELFDHILTSEDFRASKPDPDCYIAGAARCGCRPEECIVFEDSINGLKAGNASGAYVIGLSTTNPREAIEPLCDEVIGDFRVMMGGRSSTLDSVLKYTGVFGGVQGLKMLMSIVRNKLASHLLGPAGIGLMGIYVNVSESLVATTNLGLPFSTVQHLSELTEKSDAEATKQFVKLIRSWYLMLALVSMTLCVVLAPLLGMLYSDASTTVGWDIALLAPAVGAMMLTGGEVSVLKGTRHLKRVATIAFFAALATLCLTIPFFWIWGIGGIIAALNVSLVAVLIVHLCFSLPIFPWRANVLDKQIWMAGWPLVKKGIPYVLAAMAGFVMAMALPALMLRVGSLEDVGYYRVGYLLMVTYSGIVFTSMEADYFPRLAGVNHDQELRNATINQQIRVSVMLMAPLLIAMMLPMPIVIMLLYSSDFLPVCEMAICTSFYMFFRAITLPIGYTALACGHSIRYLIMEVVYDSATLAIIGSCYYTWHLAGAGIGLSLSAAFDLVLLRAYYGRCYHIRLHANTMQLIGKQALLLAATLLLCLNSSSLLLRYGVGVVILGLSLWVSYGVLARESNFVAKITQRLKR
ncbi:MAG: HAD-IA family hydrolase [Bacteroidaceae bacterium]|nr:HAD-IA family hydrolase [Bacteroidaceae bacterium]